MCFSQETKPIHRNRKINKTCEQFDEMLLAERLCQYLGVEQLAMEILDMLLEQVLVFPSCRFEIRWKF